MKPTCTSFLPSPSLGLHDLQCGFGAVRNGFSHSTGFSAFRHSSTSGAWVGSGEAITTASTLLVPNHSAPSV
jgi:hypothetical protein